MGNLCSSPQRVPEGSRKEPLVYKVENNKVVYEIVNGDVTKESVEVIVNPSNSKLQVAQVIADHAGDKIQEEVDKITKEKETLAIGEVVVTEGSGKLKFKHIIHVVLPPWRGGAEQESEQFAQGIKNALLEADKLGIKSIAIPAIAGAGVGSFSNQELTKGFINAFAEYSKESNAKTLEIVRVVASNQALFNQLTDAAEHTLSPKKEVVEVAADDHKAHHLTEATEASHSHAKEEAKEHEAHHHHKEEHAHHEAVALAHSHEEAKKDDHKHEEHVHKAEEHAHEHKAEAHAHEHKAEEHAHKAEEHAHKAEEHAHEHKAEEHAHEHKAEEHAHEHKAEEHAHEHKAEEHVHEHKAEEHAHEHKAEEHAHEHKAEEHHHAEEKAAEDTQEA